MNTEVIQQKKQAAEDAIQEYVRAQFGADEGLIVTDWVVGYNARTIEGGNDYSAVGSFTSSHSSVGMLLGIALAVFEKMKKDLL